MISIKGKYHDSLTEYTKVLFTINRKKRSTSFVLFLPENGLTFVRSVKMCNANRAQTHISKN